MKPPSPRRPRSSQGRGDSQRHAPSPRTRNPYPKAQGDASASARPHRGESGAPPRQERDFAAKPSPEDTPGAKPLQEGNVGAQPRRLGGSGVLQRQDEVSAAMRPLGRPVGPRSKVLKRPIGQRDAADVLGPQEATDLAPRREERERAKRSFYIRTTLWTLVGSLLIAGLVWLVLFSPLLAFDPHRIRVEGVQEGLISEDDVAVTLDAYKGIPLPRVPTTKIAELIETNPVVADAQVRRAWPAGLDITLSLRTGAMVEANENGFTLVDASGVAFQRVSERPEGLPLVALPQGEERKNAAEDVVTVWSALGDLVKQRTSQITADSKSVTLSLDSGALVKWGTPDDSALKSRVLEVLVSQRSASVYDVSSPAHPVTF